MSIKWQWFRYEMGGYAEGDYILVQSANRSTSSHPLFLLGSLRCSGYHSSQVLMMMPPGGGQVKLSQLSNNHLSMLLQAKMIRSEV